MGDDTCDLALSSFLLGNEGQKGWYGDSKKSLPRCCFRYRCNSFWTGLWHGGLGVTGAKWGTAKRLCAHKNRACPDERREEEPTVTSVPLPQPVRITPVIVSTAALGPVTPTLASAVIPSLLTDTVTPTVSIAPSVVVITPTVPLPSPVPARVVAPAQPAAPPVSDTPVPATALSAASVLESTAPNYNWLLWVIGLVLIVGGVVLVLMRSREQEG